MHGTYVSPYESVFEQLTLGFALITLKSYISVETFVKLHSCFQENERFELTTNKMHLCIVYSGVLVLQP